MRRFIKILIVFCIAATVFSAVGCKGCKSDKNKNASSAKFEYFVTINRTNVILEKGEQVKLSASYGDGTTAVTFSSSDEKVATVTQDGQVLANNVGICYVSAKAGSDEKTCKITVYENVYSAELIYNKTDYVLVGTDVIIDAVVFKDLQRITYLPVKWTVNDRSDNFIVLDNDTIRFNASAAGEYTIKAATDKCFVECKIVVKTTLSN